MTMTQDASAPTNPAPSDRTSDDRSDTTEADTSHSWLARVLAMLMTRKRGPSIRASLASSLSKPDTTPDSFTPEESAMLRNILDLHDRRVDEVMAQRPDIVAVSDDISLGDLLTQFRAGGHSRLPVYRESLDEPLGMVHVKDAMAYLLWGAGLEGNNRPPAGASALRAPKPADLDTPLSAADIVRPVLFAPPSMPALDLLMRMQAKRIHMALIVDEYGGTDGLVTIEDLIEEVVGEITDEHDHAETPLILIRADGALIADARAPLEDAGEALGIDLTARDEAEEVDTLGGLIVTLAGRVPAKGETIAGPEDVEFEILEAEPRRIRLVSLRRRGVPPAILALPPPDTPTSLPEGDDDTESAAVSSRSLGKVASPANNLLAGERQEG